ncbi:MAG: hypothetical protein J2P58_10405 [Acidimicrobiaceae bacterium]|nr:hypothetical protein [Acidimicrobiaceae bacterium]
MTYPWMLNLIANEHERDLLESGRRRRLARAARASNPRAPRWREVVGWRLVDLGIHLVMHPDRRVPAPSAEQTRARSFGPVT